MVLEFVLGPEQQDMLVETPIFNKLANLRLVISTIRSRKLRISAQRHEGPDRFTGSTELKRRVLAGSYYLADRCEETACSPLPFSLSPGAELMAFRN